MWVRLQFQAVIFISVPSLQHVLQQKQIQLWISHGWRTIHLCWLMGVVCLFFSYLVRNVFWCWFLWFLQWVLVLFVPCVGISIHTSVVVDAITGLSTTSSTLEYSAKKEDTNAQFTCRTVEEDLVSQPVTFTITCESPDPSKHLYCFSWVCAINSQIVTQC